MKLLIIPEAQNDIVNGMLWYEEQEAGLGKRLFAEFETCLWAISLNPLIGRVFRSKFRRYVLKKFPFCIYYLADQDLILILGFIHAHRNPAKISEWLQHRWASS